MRVWTPADASSSTVKRRAWSYDYLMSRQETLRTSAALLALGREVHQCQHHFRQPPRLSEQGAVSLQLRPMQMPAVLRDLEVELLAAGLLERVRDGAGRDSLRVTDAGIRVIAATTQKHRQSRSAHEDLVSRVALEMHRAGRVVWRGLSLRAPPVGETQTWSIVMPDVYSIRYTTVEDHVEPIAHEIKVSRADLLSDLRNEAKRESTVTSTMT